MQGFTHTVARAGGIAFGVATHALFAVTVWHLVWFLAGHGPGAGTPPADVATTVRAITIDAMLATLFAVPHSVLLLPAVRRSLTTRLVPPAFYGCFYCVVTCVALVTTIRAWQPSDVVVWAWPASLGPWVTAAFIGSALKDRRLTFFIGEPYREYQALVPGYPGMPFGPLARVPAGTMGP